MNLYTGIDVESADRFQKLIYQKSEILSRIFFELEYEYAIDKVNPAQSFAGIWCAKESVVKSFNKIRKITIRDIEIISCKGSAPEILFRNYKDKGLAFTISVSISHTSDYATAVCILQIL